jgi:hypothetical protein
MQLQNAGVRSILLTSGTLSPMDSFAHELVRALLAQVVNVKCTLHTFYVTQHLPFPIRLENSHVIAASQVRQITTILWSLAPCIDAWIHVLMSCLRFGSAPSTPAQATAH